MGVNGLEDTFQGAQKGAKFRAFMIVVGIELCVGFFIGAVLIWLALGVFFNLPRAMHSLWLRFWLLPWWARLGVLLGLPVVLIGLKYEELGLICAVLVAALVIVPSLWGHWLKLLISAFAIIAIPVVLISHGYNWGWIVFLLGMAALGVNLMRWVTAQ